MHWRKSTWVFVIWSALMLLWAIGGAAGANCRNATYEGACNAGVTIAWIVILFIWFLGAVPMAIIWYATKPKLRTCPVCGTDARPGVIQCQRCGYSFAAAFGMPTGPSCPQCRTPLAAGQPRCMNCGLPIQWGPAAR
jgi:hypothetical protein